MFFNLFKRFLKRVFVYVHASVPDNPKPVLNIIIFTSFERRNAYCNAASHYLPVAVKENQVPKISP